MTGHQALVLLAFLAALVICACIEISAGLDTEPRFISEHQFEQECRHALRYEDTRCI